MFVRISTITTSTGLKLKINFILMKPSCVLRPNANTEASNKFLVAKSNSSIHQPSIGTYNLYIYFL